MGSDNTSDDFALERENTNNWHMKLKKYIDNWPKNKQKKTTKNILNKPTVRLEQFWGHFKSAMYQKKKKKKKLP